MTVEELLKPRYEVIADYPGNFVPVGSVIEFDCEVVWIKKDGEYVSNDKITAGVHSSYYFNNVLKIKSFPHLFCHLAWYEKRDVSELPEYVKTKAGNVVRKLVQVGWGKVYIVIDGKAKVRSAKDWFPATETEYLNYINNQK